MTNSVILTAPPPEGLDDAPNTDTEPDRTECRVEGCGKPVAAYSGRGRRPTTCEEHKGNTAKTGSTTRATKTADLERNLVSLCEMVNTGGQAIRLINPADGRVLAVGMPNVCHELAELAKTDRALRKFLENLTAPGKYGPLVLATMPVVFGIAMNHGLVPTLFVPVSTPEQSTAA